MRDEIFTKMGMLFIVLEIQHLTNIASGCKRITTCRSRAAEQQRNQRRTGSITRCSSFVCNRRTTPTR